MGVAGWDPGRVWTGAENLALAGIRSPHRLADPYERDPYSDVLYRVFQSFNKILLYDLSWAWYALENATCRVCFITVVFCVVYDVSTSWLCCSVRWMLLSRNVIYSGSCRQFFLSLCLLSYLFRHVWSGKKRPNVFRRLTVRVYGNTLAIF